MTINFSLHTIELTTAEMKEAQKFGSDMYNMVREARIDNPGFNVKEVKAKAKKAKNDFGDLNMKTIKAYVEKHGTEEQKEHFAFISKKSIDAEGEYVEAQSFFEIKKWFLNEFTELKKARKDYREKVQAIYEAAEAKACA
jgi:hypothetical protein